LFRSMINHPTIWNYYEHFARELKVMVGFRNIAVHNYQAVDLGNVQGIIEKNLADLMKFGQLVLTIK
ncbi:MAG: DUF86 domain-containing protein, partial [Nostocales cyanobacterium W4_Combined_metabat2_030]|nr:DUF86 domain-containing protein [Nostocales cyanobacterium W4_Combined_metabat2_030]